jgi:hypothetical protein
MKIQKWVVAAIIYLLVEFIMTLFSYILGHDLLQLPLWEVGIVTGLTILVSTIGIAIPIIALRSRQKKQRGGKNES